jgi:hypothetical protein
MRATSPDHSVRSAFDLAVWPSRPTRVDRGGNAYCELNATHKKLVTKRRPILFDPVGGTWRGP